MESLYPPVDNKIYLNQLKQCLQEMTSKDMCEKELRDLSRLYLDCPTKLPAKRMISSFFQNTCENTKLRLEKIVCDELVTKLRTSLEAVHSNTTDVNLTSQGLAPRPTSIRHCVDTISAFLDNFKLGVIWLGSVVSEVLNFLSQAQIYFYSLISKDMSPVQLNTSMHDCHASSQCLNLVLQKLVVGTDGRKDLQRSTSLVVSLLDNSLQIIHDESFLLDCRCCCAMTCVILLQLFLSPSDVLSVFTSASTNMESSQIECVWLNNDHQSGLNMNAGSVCVYLSLAFGLWAVLDLRQIIETNDPHTIRVLLDELIPSVLQKGYSCTDVVSKTLHGKIVSLVSSRILSSLSTCVPPPRVLSQFSGGGQVLQSLLTYVWSNWTDQLDAIRQNSKTVFENVVKIHIRIKSDETKEDDEFVKNLVKHLMSVSWSTRCKYSALTSCVHALGAGPILQLCPNLMSDVVGQFVDQSISCHASELYISLLVSLRSTKLMNMQSADLWLDPAIHGLLSNDQKLKRNITEYLIPKLLKTEPLILDYIKHRFSATESDEGYSGAFITCLRRSRVMGLLDKQGMAVSDFDNSPWMNYLSNQHLETALMSMDEQVRLEAFGLVCENHKLTQVVTVAEFEITKLFIPANLANQSPAYRQSCLALMKKLLVRIKESTGPLVKRNQQEFLSLYKRYLTWLADVLFENIYPGAAFARRTFSLSLLSTISGLFSTDLGLGFSIPSYMTAAHVSRLIDVFSDTFEENKKEALNLLSVFTKHRGALMDKEKMLSLLIVSFSLACSTKPQDGTTAAYLFLLLLKQPSIVVCLSAARLPLNCEETKQRLPIIHHDYTQYSDCSSETPSLYLLELLIVLLQDQLLVANASLLRAAANRPIYPTLHCVRYILASISWRTLTEETRPRAKRIVSCLVSTCLDIARVVSPVVQNSSPEGNVPTEAVGGTDTESLAVSDGGQDASSRCLVESMPEYLVVCCWRSIKEVSLSFGSMAQQLSLSVHDAPEYLLNYTQINEMGAYFKEQLLESIHRGAFELAYAGFQMLCQTLWSHPKSELHQLPVTWLNYVIEDIQSNSNLCATRRSAGVPFFVQAITSTEPTTAGRACFHSAMKTLLRLAATNPDDSTINLPIDVAVTSDDTARCSLDSKENTSSDAQVHAVNILRALYRDTRLGEDVLPYVSDGLITAIRGFHSQSWAVRNSSTLLLSTLMTRIFGVKRSKDETIMSKKNCQTGRSFFYHYPGLYSFLLTELEQATANIGSGKLELHPSLYPVLLVLARLFPSSLEGQDTNLSLSAFIPHIMRCASSPVLKTRVIAARALKPMARRRDIVHISTDLLNQLPAKPANHNHSFVHGVLLQLKEILGLAHELPAPMKQELVENLSTRLTTSIWIFSLEKCPVTAEIAIELLDQILSLSSVTQTTESLARLRTCLVHTVTTSTPNLAPWTPMSYRLEARKATLCLKHVLGQSSEKLLKDQLISFLKSPFYEVRLEILNLLLLSMRDLGESRNSAKDNSNIEYSKQMLLDLKGAAIDIFTNILDIALKTETHFECLEKLYLVLWTCSENGTLIEDRLEKAQAIAYFSELLVRIKAERHEEVTSAMVGFTGSFIPVLRQMLTNETTASKSRLLLTEWINDFSDWCQLDDPDLHLSCTRVLKQNGRILLFDQNNIIENWPLTSWHCLYLLLQDDDLQVKEEAAEAFCLANRLHPQALHPSSALQQLAGRFLCARGTSNMSSSIHQLLRWVCEDNNQSRGEVNEDTRLFDKGDANTYWDPRNFRTCVLEIFRTIMKIQSLPTEKKISRDATNNKSTHFQEQTREVTKNNTNLERQSYKADDNKCFQIATSFTEKIVGDSTISLNKEQNRIKISTLEMHDFLVESFDWLNMPSMTTTVNDSKLKSWIVTKLHNFKEELETRKTDMELFSRFNNVPQYTQTCDLFSRAKSLIEVLQQIHNLHPGILEAICQIKSTVDFYEQFNWK